MVPVWLSNRGVLSGGRCIQGSTMTIANPWNPDNKIQILIFHHGYKFSVELMRDLQNFFKYQLNSSSYVIMSPFFFHTVLPRMISRYYEEKPCADHWGLLKLHHWDV